MKIGGRLTIGFALLTGLLIVITGFSMMLIRTSANNLKTVVTDFLPAIDFLEQADRDFFQLIEAERTQLLLGPAGEQNKKWADAWQENLDQAIERMAGYANLASSAEEKKLYDEYLVAHQKWLSLSKTVMAGATSTSPIEAAKARELSLGEESAAFEAMRENINKLEEIVMANAEELRVTTDKASSLAFTSLLVLASIAVALAVGVSVFLTLGITRPLRECVRISNAMAKGDLSLTVEERWTSSKDETGDLAKAMSATVHKMNSVVSEVQLSSTSVAHGASELSTAAQQMATGIAGIAESSQQLSQGATEQAASAEEVSASVEQMGANIKQNADNSFQTEKIATKAAGDAKQGAQAVAETVLPCAR
ncbi:hypothetical protein MASR2M48_32370 [Spirochaetota bacterium]